MDKAVFLQPVELTDAELDWVAAGANSNAGAAAGAAAAGLVAAGAAVAAAVSATVENVANHNSIAVDVL